VLAILFADKAAFEAPAIIQGSIQLPGLKPLSGIKIRQIFFRSEAERWSTSRKKSVKRSFASKCFKTRFLTQSFASRFKLRFAQPFLAKFKKTTNWSLSPQGLTFLRKNDKLVAFSDDVKIARRS